MRYDQTNQFLSTMREAGEHTLCLSLLSGTYVAQNCAVGTQYSTTIRQPNFESADGVSVTDREVVAHLHIACGTVLLYLLYTVLYSM